jgi:hypothetical protein
MVRTVASPTCETPCVPAAGRVAADGPADGQTARRPRHTSPATRGGRGPAQAIMLTSGIWGTAASGQAPARPSQLASARTLPHPQRPASLGACRAGRTNKGESKSTAAGLTWHLRKPSCTPVLDGSLGPRLVAWAVATHSRPGSRNQRAMTHKRCPTTCNPSGSASPASQVLSRTSSRTLAAETAQRFAATSSLRSKSKALNSSRMMLRSAAKPMPPSPLSPASPAQA